MPILCHQLRLAYFGIPKVASSSLKSLFHELDHGDALRQPRTAWQRLRKAVWGGNIGVPIVPHHLEEYWSTSFAEGIPVPDGYESFALLRDPIHRLHSAWSNKVRSTVLIRTVQNSQDLHNEGLAPDPDFGTFIDQFETYFLICRPVRVHTRRLAWHFGPEPGRFDHLFTLEAFEELTAYLSARARRPIAVPRLNEQIPETRRTDLTVPQIDKLRHITKEDYAWCGPLYNQDEQLNKFTNQHGRLS